MRTAIPKNRSAKRARRYGRPSIRIWGAGIRKRSATGNRRWRGAGRKWERAAGGFAVVMIAILDGRRNAAAASWANPSTHLRIVLLNRE